MTTLFDKVSGTSTETSGDGVVDSSADFRIDEFKGFFVCAEGVERLILSNTKTKLVTGFAFNNGGAYEIAIINRDYLNEIESDFSDTTKISDDLISKKYAQTNIDVSNRTVAYLRPLYGMDNSFYKKNGSFVDDFDPLENILNLLIMQQTFAYYLIYLVFKDLSLDSQSHNYFKSEDHFTLFKNTIKDSLALIQIDFDEDGEADTNEKRNSVSYTRLTR